MAEDIQKTTKPLTNKQLKAISLLLTGLEQKQIAEELGVNELTLSRWKELPQFKEELQKRRRRLVDEAMDYLTRSVKEVTEKLVSLTHAENENVRLRACQAVLDNIKEGIELSELKDRLEALEKAISREKPRLRRVA